METLAIRILIAVLGVAVSARTRLTAVVAGQAYSVPVITVVAVVVVLLRVAVVLLVARSVVRDGGLRLRPVAS